MTVIVNPISGTGGRRDVARERVETARAFLTARGLPPNVLVSERPGHARELARRALDEGERTVAGWGGDGTVNEIASVLAFTGAALGIVPSGSGNGLARELGIPTEPNEALSIAFGAHERVIDAGELDGRLFFNIAGVGLDAQVAFRFAAGGLLRRGFLRYLEITAAELLSYSPSELTVVVDGAATRARPLIVALANARQYGNGAIIAPRAVLDDGLLDVVVVEHRSVAATLRQAPRLFSGRIDQVPGVTMQRGATVEIASLAPLLYHVDGEPFAGGRSIRARAVPAALRVRTPVFTENLPA